MKQLIYIVLLSMLDFLEGESLTDADSQVDYHKPGKTILYNILREHCRPININRQKFTAIDDLAGISRNTNCLTQFLNRFQPAMDRESKNMADNGQEAEEFSCFKILSQNRNKPNYLKEKDYRESVKRENSDLTNKQDKILQMCTKVPGKVICEFGKFTYVINTKDHEMSNEELEKVVDAMQQRISEGDKTFDISVMGPANSMPSIRSKASLVEAMSSDNSVQDNSPIMVECSPVERARDNKQLLPEGVKETVFSCKWHSLKLKRAVIKDKANNKSKVVKHSKQDGDAVIYNTPVSRTCSTPIFVRKFTDYCKPTISWCPETTFLPCSSTFLPHCIPWCNPFIKEPNQPQRKQA